MLCTVGCYKKVHMDLGLKITLSVKIIPKTRALSNDTFCLDRVNYVFLLVFSCLIEKILLTFTGEYLRALTVSSRKEKE